MSNVRPMKASVLVAFCAVSAFAYANDTSPPIADGRYTFVVKLAEQPNVPGGELDAEVRGRNIRFTSKPNSSVFPAGLVEEGILLWHAASRQWIIGHSEGDAEITEVGGCTGGPFVVDLEQKIFWTC
jgi:hypothetical protein